MSTSINIIPNNNLVSVQDSSNQLTITNNNSNVTVDVTQPVTNIVQVLTGPQGQKGDPGPTNIIDTGSFVLNSQTSSMTVLSASFASTASNTPNAIITASVSFNTITFTKGNGSTFPITVNTGSGGGSTPAAGNNYEIQFNSASVFQGNSNFIYNYVSNSFQHGELLDLDPTTYGAQGIYSHAEGILTFASGAHSHAEGGDTKALGLGSHAEGAYTQAIGIYSHAEGNGTQAVGDYSHAEGDITQATGFGSHAEGYDVRSSGSYSHAEGETTIASGFASHAEGLTTLASGDYSHAEGGGATASGISSHAEGGNTQAIGDYSHAEGQETIASGLYSHAEGYQTIAIGERSHAEGNNTKAIGNYSHAEGTLNTSGYKGFLSTDIGLSVAGTIFLNASYGDVSSLFIAGNSIILSDTDEDNTYGTIKLEIGGSSFDGSYTLINLVDTTIATSIAIIGLADEPEPSGANIMSGGSYSHTEGYTNKVIGWFSHTEGYLTQAVGDKSHAEGIGTETTGEGSHAEGNSTYAIGNYSHTEGNYTRAIGYGSHAEGYFAQTGTTNAYGRGKLNLIINGSVTLSSTYGNVTSEFQPGQLLYLYDPANLGRKIYKIQSSNFFIGTTTIQLTDNTVNTANGCVVCPNFGIQNHSGDQTIPANNSHAEGNDTSTLDDYSHAEGYLTQAVGINSHAEGSNTIALGESSHAEGLGTITSGSYQHVQGQFNLSSSAQSAFIIGNGTADNARSNLVFASGSEFQISGSLRVRDNVTVNTNTFAIDSVNNRVGIGKTNPSTALDVNGNTIVTGSFTIVTGSAIELRVTNTGVAIGSALTDIHPITGFVRVTGSLILTGSMQNNVAALTITSNTASLDLNRSNFFTLQLVAGVNTHINPSNIKPGQTAILQVSTTGSGTVSFPSSVKQPSGSSYTPTITTGIDILTLASFDDSTLYVVNTKNLI